MQEPEPTTEIIGCQGRPVALNLGRSQSACPIDDEDAGPPPTEEELAKWDHLGQLVKFALRASSRNRDVNAPEWIGTFRILSVLGRGGNGTVYLAQDSVLPRTVAVKVPHGDLLRRPGTRERFLQEARLVAGLKHPHIVEIHQIGEALGLPYLVFEYCEGSSLAEWLHHRDVPLTPRTCAEITKMLASAIQHAHSQGILHRDLNPRNALLVPDRQTDRARNDREFPFVVKLSDFGLGMWLNAEQDAVQTQTGAVVGTIPYMAPEQTHGTSRFLQPTVDVHALGLLLFELLTQQRPYVGATPIETLRLIQDSAPPFPRRIRKNIPRDLETICLKCLEKSPDERYPTAQMLINDLDRYLTHRPILARRTSMSAQAVQWMTRHPLVAALLGVICLLSGLIGIGSSWYSARLALSNRKAGELLTQSKQSEERVQAMAYAGQIRRAQELLDAGYDHAAGQLLRHWMPENTPGDHRKFEWYYLLQASGGEMIPLPRRATENESAYCASVSADGHYLYLGAEQFVEKWDLRELALKEKFDLPGARDICVSQQGDLFLTRGGVSNVYRWSTVRNLELPAIGKIDERERFCARVTLTPDERAVISLSSQGPPFHPPCALRSYDTATSHMNWEYVWPMSSAFDVVFDRTLQQYIVTLANELHVLSSTGQLLYQFPIPAGSSNGLSLALSPHSTWLTLSLEDHRILLFRKNPVGRWNQVGELPTARVTPEPAVDGKHAYFTTRNPLVFTPDSRQLYSASGTELHLWDIENRVELQASLKLPHPVRALKLLPDGSTAVWATAFDVGLWKPVPRQVQVAGHTRETWSVAFSPDGRWLASGSDDDTISIWDLKSGKEHYKLQGHSATVSAVAFSPDGHRLASASLDQSIRVWNMQRPTEFQELKGHPGTVRCLAWAPDGQTLISGDHQHNGPNSVIHWDLLLGRPRATWQDQRGRVRSALITKDGRRCITLSEDMTVVIRDLRSGEVERRLDDSQQLHSGVLLNHDRWLAGGTKFGIIRIWDLTSGDLIKELRGHAVSVRSLALSPDGKVLASGSEDMTVRLWDTQSDECVLVLRGHQAPVNSVAFSPNGEILASGAHDGTVKLWHGPRLRDAENIGEVATDIGR